MKVVLEIEALDLPPNTQNKQWVIDTIKEALQGEFDETPVTMFMINEITVFQSEPKRCQSTA